MSGRRQAQIRRSTREVNVGAPIAPLRAALARQPEGRPEETDFQTQAQARLTQVSPCLESDTADAADGRIRWCQSSGPGGRQGCSGQC